MNVKFGKIKVKTMHSSMEPKLPIIFTIIHILIIFLALKL